MKIRTFDSAHICTQNHIQMIKWGLLSILESSYTGYKRTLVCLGSTAIADYKRWGLDRCRSCAGQETSRKADFIKWTQRIYSNFTFLRNFLKLVLAGKSTHFIGFYTHTFFRPKIPKPPIVLSEITKDYKSSPKYF